MSEGKEVRLNPELLTFRELEYNEAEKKFHYKINELRSEVGGFKSGMSKTTGASQNFCSFLTKLDSRSSGVTTGYASLVSGGFKFMLKEILCVATSAKVMSATVRVLDNTTQKLAVKFFTGAVGTNQRTLHIKDLYGVKFGSSVIVRCSTAGVSVHLGGLRWSVQA